MDKKTATLLLVVFIDLIGLGIVAGLIYFFGKNYLKFMKDDIASRPKALGH